MSFTPETVESIARARQHSVGDLLRRTALRYPASSRSWQANDG